MPIQGMFALLYIFNLITKDDSAHCDSSVVIMLTLADRDDEPVLFKHPVFLEESLYSRAIIISFPLK